MDKERVICLLSTDNFHHVLIEEQLDETAEAAGAWDQQFLKLLFYALAKEGRAALVTAVADGQLKVGILKAKSRVVNQTIIPVFHLQWLNSEDSVYQQWWSSKNKNQTGEQPGLASYMSLGNPMALLPFLKDSQVLDLTRAFIQSSVSSSDANPQQMYDTLSSIVGYLHTSVAEHKERKWQDSSVPGVDQLKQVLEQCQQLLKTIYANPE